MERIHFNLNNEILVKLTDLGYHHLAMHSNDVMGRFLTEPITTDTLRKTEDSDGYYPIQAWEFIKIFGPVTGMGMPDLYNTNIILLQNSHTTQ